MAERSHPATYGIHVSPITHTRSLKDSSNVRTTEILSAAARKFHSYFSPSLWLLISLGWLICSCLYPKWSCLCCRNPLCPVSAPNVALPVVCTYSTGTQQEQLQIYMAGPYAFPCSAILPADWFKHYFLLSCIHYHNPQEGKSDIIVLGGVVSTQHTCGPNSSQTPCECLLWQEELCCECFVHSFFFKIISWMNLLALTPKIIIDFLWHILITIVLF